MLSRGVGAASGEPSLLVIAPTRELAIQIQEEGEKLLGVDRDRGGGDDDPHVWCMYIYIYIFFFFYIPKCSMELVYSSRFG